MLDTDNQLGCLRKTILLLWALFSICQLEKAHPMLGWGGKSQQHFVLSNSFLEHHVRLFPRQTGHCRADRFTLINTWPQAGSLLQELSWCALWRSWGEPPQVWYAFSFLSSWLFCQLQLLDAILTVTALKKPLGSVFSDENGSWVFLSPCSVLMTPTLVCALTYALGWISKTDCSFLGHFHNTQNASGEHSHPAWNPGRTSNGVGYCGLLVWGVPSSSDSASSLTVFEASSSRSLLVC